MSYGSGGNATYKEDRGMLLGGVRKVVEMLSVIRSNRRRIDLRGDLGKAVNYLR